MTLSVRSALPIREAQPTREALPLRETLSAFGGVEFDPRVHDSAFLEEIDLYSELIIVAAASAGTMTAADIDRALGIVLR